MLTVLRPKVIVTFSESGVWARVLPAVADAAGIGSLDIAHAELNSVAPLVGVGYSKYAVLGETSADRLMAAGVPPDRIAVTGAPQYDRLFQIASEPTPGRRRVLFASQYLIGAMTAGVKEATMLSALDFAASAAPADFIVLRHPLETDSVIQTVLANRPVPPDVEITEGRDLYSELPGSFALVTAWSNSVLEAVIAGVPAIVARTGSAVTDSGYETDGLAIGLDAKNAPQIVQRLSNPTTRRAWVDSARQALRTRNVAPDGRAGERIAALVLELVNSSAQ